MRYLDPSLNANARLEQLVKLPRRMYGKSTRELFDALKEVEQFDVLSMGDLRKECAARRNIAHTALMEMIEMSDMSESVPRVTINRYAWAYFLRHILCGTVLVVLVLLAFFAWHIAAGATFKENRCGQPSNDADAESWGRCCSGSGRISGRHAVELDRAVSNGRGYRLSSACPVNHQ